MKVNPLYTIFEKHLYEFNYETRENFINSVVREYVVHITKSKIMIPHTKRSLLENTLADEVSDMLVRKIYGCLKVENGDFKVDEKIKRALENFPKDENGSGNSGNLTPDELKKRLQKLIR